MDGRLKSSESSRPLGASTRRISQQRPLQIGHVPQPVADRHDRERAVGKRQREHVAGDECAWRRVRTFRRIRRERRFVPRASCSIRNVTSRPTARCTCGAAANDEVAGSAREIEHAIGRLQRGELNQPPLPAAILSVGKKPGDEVVAVGDGGKQLADVAPFAFRRGDACGGAVKSLNRTIT